VRAEPHSTHPVIRSGIPTTKRIDRSLRIQDQLGPGGTVALDGLRCPGRWMVSRIQSQLQLFPPVMPDAGLRPSVSVRNIGAERATLSTRSTDSDSTGESADPNTRLTRLNLTVCAQSLERCRSSRSSESTLRISAGRGGQPVIRTSTGMWRSTGPVTA